MTELAFHFGAADKLGYAARLLRKASASGAKVTVVAPPDILAQLDSALWALGPTDFVTHCDTQASPSQQAHSSVLLCTGLDQVPVGRTVLVNLSPEVPEGFAAYARVIELVSNDEVDRQEGRQRWKRYTQDGYAITRHDLVAKGGAA